MALVLYSCNKYFQANGRRSPRGTVQPGGAPCGTGKASEVSLDGHAVKSFACDAEDGFYSSIIPCPIFLDPVFCDEMPFS